MKVTSPGPRTWDEAAGSASDEPVRRFEASWRAGRPDRRPDPDDFVGDGSPGVRLALFRADLGLRWDAGDRAGAERYRGRGLPDDAMIALAYEEFCLREDQGEAPEPSGFYARFPEVASGLRRVLEIHDLVGSGRATSTASLGLRAPAGPALPFPEAGQTIAGFHLVEELGRGGFARVFLAKERQLADRPVALKVAKAGSREPQTLARLQHTHIVPVHSYRIDPATGLHLLCMPYFGRVTLAHLLADPAMKEARAGSEIIGALDRLDPEGSAATSARPAGREALGSRPYARAVAWWGARLAEALQHAHDRGVLHRDVKPSNVLVTADGMPMLLDFNLAHEPLEPSDSLDAPAALGGTVAYMSPEHLEALADGRTDGVDGRSDVYALGVVLFEAMGARPFGPPPQSRSVREALLRAAEERRGRRTRLRDDFPEVPAALATVVERCLQPDPDARYASAADLAADLQAVADAMPLRHAREPIGDRLRSKVRRHRRAMAATATVLLTIGLAGFMSLSARMADERLQAQVRHNLGLGYAALDGDHFKQARQYFETAERLAEGSSALEGLAREARRQAAIAGDAVQTLADAEALFRDAEPLRLALLGIDADRSAATPVPALDAVLGPFFVLKNRDWTDRGELKILGLDRARLVGEVHELLYLGAIRAAGGDRQEAWQSALRICRKVREIRASRAADADREALLTLPEGPWSALERHVLARVEGRPPPRSSPPPPSMIASAWECYQWGRLILLEDRPDPGRAAPWLVRAGRRDSGRFWLKFDVAYQADRAGLADLALELYNAAVELRPEYPRALANRARLERAKGLWGLALEDLERALLVEPGRVEPRLELGLVHQALGNTAAAIAAYDAVIKQPRAGPYRRAALLNRAKLDFDAGLVREARSALDGLILEDPGDAAVRLGRAVISVHQGDLVAAEEDLDASLRSRPGDVEPLALRALVRLLRGRPLDAEADAEAAARIEPTPRRQRLLTRIRLAKRAGPVPSLDDPQEVRLLPAGGPSLEADLRDAAERLGRGVPSAASRSTLAVILAALGDTAGAEHQAGRAVEEAPLSPRARLVRARVRLERGDRPGALDDVAQGLESEPDDPRLLALRGRLRLEAGDPVEALADLEKALRLGAGSRAACARAEAHERLGRTQEALEDWNLAIRRDPDDPTAFLGRARAFLALGQWDQALADLEHAAEAAGDRRAVLAGVAWSYARCLPRRPGRWPRVAAIARRAIGP